MAQDTAHEEEVFTGRIDLAVWRKILAFARPYRRQLLLLSASGALVAGLDVLFPYLTGRIIDEVKAAGPDARLAAFTSWYGTAIVAFAACVFAFIIFAGRITTGVSYDIRRTCFAKLQDLPFSFYDRKPVGWLMARLTSDCSSLSRVMAWALLDIVWGICLLLSVSVVMFYLNWRLALIVLSITPALVLVSRFFQTRLLLTSRALRKANSQTTAAFNEGIVGVRTTKSLVREDQNSVEFGHLTDSMYTYALSNALYSALFIPLVLSICSVGVALALWRGGIDVATGDIRLGVLVTFIQYAGLISNPIQELANTLTVIQGAQASAERVQSLLDAEVEIKDSPEVRAKMKSSKDRNMESFRSPGRPINDSMHQSSDDSIAPDGHPSRIRSIEFRNVTFAYKQGQTVLRDFNLAVHAGQSIALVGPTGGGKSTIVALTCRFYEPTAGQILINGVDYRQRSLHWLQSNLGMVLQQPHLFSGTIRENIRYGRLDATDAEIVDAAMLVNAHDFISSMKDGYDSPVGEGGNQLSTGQKQLIALARAVIARPQIFVMDEATSSVDTQTERAIQSAVDRILKKQISFVIAHRLSTIRSADRILVISGGQIIEQGNHHSLVEQRGHYFDLYTNQFTHEHEDEMLHYSTPTAD